MAFLHPFSSIRWSLLCFLLFCFCACNSTFEFGTFAVPLHSPTLVARVDCTHLSESAQLVPQVFVRITAGSQSSGIVQLRRVVLEYCVDPITALQTKQSSTSASEDACEAESEAVDSTKSSRLTPCTLFTKRVCLSSLRLPNVLTCTPPKQQQQRRNSLCFLEAKGTLTYNLRNEQDANQIVQQTTEIPLRGLNEPGFRPKTNQEWGQICCETASQECTEDAQCNGRGTCQGTCAKTGEACNTTTLCPTIPQRCLSLCDDLFQQCKTQQECPQTTTTPPQAGTCQRRCQQTGNPCNTDTDCVPATQICQRYCTSVGKLCQQRDNCAQGEDCLQTCSVSHHPCADNSQCPTGETCQKQCVSSAQLLVYTGMDTDLETTYAQHASPRSFRLLCRNANGQPFSLHTLCKAATSTTSPSPTVCAGP